MATGSLTETSTIQAAVVHRLSQKDMGWTFIEGDDLPRSYSDVLIESDVAEALQRLNPLIKANPDYADEILPKLRALILSVYDDGLMATNETMMKWLKGDQEHQFVGESYPEPVQLIDFENPRANTRIVAREVVFKVGGEERRYDIVLFVNGIPLVVGETKTPFKDKKSWLNAANDIHGTYEPKTPGFFVPNVLEVATEGKDFRYAAIETPPEMWLPWGKTDEPLLPTGMKRALRGVELLLTPEMVLDILRTYTLYSIDSKGSAAKTIKIIPRYPQVEAVEAIVKRALDPERHRGLIWHHQGSGKTLLMAFAAVKLLREHDAPTIVIALDRLDLDEQTTREFRSAGLDIDTAETKEQLRTLLGKHDRRGVIVTTVFRFKDAGVLNERKNIVVFADEAHRTQEGKLGRAMREALPNATYFGLTGTPISTKDHDTFETFGHKDDPDYILNSYPPERSIADGATLQVITETRLADLHIDKTALDEAFDAMAEEEGLSDEEKELLARKATRLTTLLKSPERIRKVCEDIVDHFSKRIEPLGLKAQVVCYDRELCVLYQKEMARLLAERGDGWESTVVMTTRDKDETDGVFAKADEFRPFARDRTQEADIKNRFRNFNDPLKFLIVTSKLLTGFDAPIEGVMYLDKPLKKHTLFQAITRTNRRWTNPDTGQEKTAGLVVDYIGLGTEIAEAMQMGKKEHGEKVATEDVPTLQAELISAIETALERFDGIDRKKADFETLMDAQDRLADEETRDTFAREFLLAQSLFEFLDPASGLSPEQQLDYRWLAKIYQSVQPATSSDALLWHRLGAKTHELIAQHVGDIEIGKGGATTIVLDEESIEQLKILGLDDGGNGKDEKDPPTAAEVIDSIQKRLDARLKGNPSHTVYRSLAERLDALRQTFIETAEDSIEFLKKLLEVARAVVEAEKEQVAEEGASALADGGEEESLLPEERMGALTQIFNEYAPEATPEIVERVVLEIDSVLMSATGAQRIAFRGWQQSTAGDKAVKVEIRAALNKFGLPPTGELFDRAYAYIAEHY
jgi:type I restriction enzyme, R subunit